MRPLPDRDIETTRVPGPGSDAGRTGCLYLPIEIARRELESRLVIAHFAIQAGLQVVLGSKWQIDKNMSRLPPGAILLKTLTPRDGRTIDLAHKHGFVAAAIDEEMLGVGRDHLDLWWLGSGTVAAVDAVFCQGRFQFEAMAKKYPAAAAKLVVTGNPRIDLLASPLVNIHARAAQEIRAKHGRFVLINTNLTVVNSRKGSAEEIVKSMETHGKSDPNSARDREIRQKGIRHQEDCRALILAAIARIRGEFPDLGVVIRPHPTENWDYWEAEAAKLEGVTVETAGSVVPWLLAAQAMLHTACTTGVEAFYLRKLAISLQPRENPWLDYYLSNALNFVTDDIDWVVQELRQSLRDDDAPFSYPAEISARAAIFLEHTPGQTASERVVGAIGDLMQARGLLLETERRRQPWRPHRRLKSVHSREGYRTQLLEGFNEDAVRGKLRELSQLFGQDVFVRRFSPHLFHLAGRPYPSRLRTALRTLQSKLAGGRAILP